MLKRHTFLCAAAGALLCVSALCATALEPPYPVSAQKVVKSGYMLRDGAFVENDESGFCAQIYLEVDEDAPDNSEYALTVSSDVLAPNVESVRLVRFGDGEAELLNTPVKKTKEGFVANITAGAQTVSDGRLCVYFDAEQEQSGTLGVSVSPVLREGFGEGIKLNVGAYSVEKQGAGCAAVEIAAGLSGMSESSEVYVISDASGELFRAVCDSGELLGLARRDGAMVVSIEYDVANKYYINSVSRKKVLEKQAVLDTLSVLGFSFVSPPTDSLFVDSQNDYASSLTVRVD